MLIGQLALVITVNVQVPPLKGGRRAQSCPLVVWTSLLMGVMYSFPPPSLCAVCREARACWPRQELEDKDFHCSAPSVSSLDLRKVKLMRFKSAELWVEMNSKVLCLPGLLPVFFFCLKFSRKSLVFMLPETCISSQNWSLSHFGCFSPPLTNLVLFITYHRVIWGSCRNQCGHISSKSSAPSV